MAKHAKNKLDGNQIDSEGSKGARRAGNRSRSVEDQAPETALGASSDDEKDRIGLTEAFAPVDGEAFRQAEAAGDEHIGLTEAFAPVGEGSHAGSFSYQGDKEDEYPDALQSLEPPELPPLLVADDASLRDSDKERVSGRHGKEEPVPAYQHKSRRMRRVLIGIIVVLVVLLVAAVVAGVMLVRTASETAVQMAASTQNQTDDELQEGVEDANEQAEKIVTAPDLTSLLGLTQEDAIAAVGHGATVTATTEVNEEGNPVRTNVTVALTEEPADTRSGTPTVYLGLDEAGAVVQAGYSAPTSSLGFGSLSFADAVTNEHVIEKTLAEAGIPVEEGAAVLPDDKAEYSTYDSDGTTLVRENYTFEGTVDIDGASHAWSSTLSYDYTTANASDNLADTIRLIYVFVDA